MTDRELLIRRALRATIREAEALVRELRLIEGEEFYDGIPLDGRYTTSIHNAIHRVKRELITFDERIGLKGDRGME